MSKHKKRAKARSKIARAYSRPLGGIGLFREPKLFKALRKALKKVRTGL